MSQLSALWDVCGRNRLENEDPRWTSLFKTHSVLGFKGQEADLQEYIQKLAQNNHKTGNALTLLQHVSSRLKDLLQNYKNMRPVPDLQFLKEVQQATLSQPSEQSP